MMKDVVKTGLGIANRIGVSSLGGAMVTATTLACPCGPVMLGCRVLAGYFISLYAGDKLQETIDKTVDDFADLVHDIKIVCKEESN